MGLRGHIWRKRAHYIELIIPMMIESSDFGRMRIQGRDYFRDLLIVDGRVLPDWWRAQGHRLIPADLKEVLDAAPAVLVVGTGVAGMMEVPEETRRTLRDRGIRLEEARTAEAIKIFNRLFASQEDVAGAFHLTC
jgi:hypothetical protein